MTLSHEPWLVLPSRRVAVRGNHGGRRLVSNRDEYPWFHCRTLLSRCIVGPATGLRRQKFVGISPARISSLTGHLTFPKLAFFLNCMIDAGIGGRAIVMPFGSAQSHANPMRKCTAGIRGAKSSPEALSASSKGLANA
jgi:hypothetical protein